MFRFLAFLFLLSSTSLFAQLNTTLRDQLEYPANVNDIWGYVAPDGTEYAIVGTEIGISFVSLANPDTIEEVAFIDGDFSAWRDMKTFGTYAYSVADQGSQGITAFDLSNLPNEVTITRTTYDVPGSTDRFVRAHNLYIDETTGILYTAGGSRNIRDGGILMFNLNDTPATPELVAVGPPVYSHDVYVQDGVMYASEIYRGDLTLYDVSDLDNITEMGRAGTPFDFTHNAWSNAEGRYVYTTDEKANAPVASYDVGNPQDIQLLDEYRPAATIGLGVIPHNAHVIDEYVSISYYTDGLRVVDGSVPDNLVEVANYDTFLGPDGDFNGAWGAYPFLPSGLTLISDRQSGLFVVDVDYQRAGRLYGIITDFDTGEAINGAVVTVSSPEARVSTTGALGRYKTGVASTGTYIITVEAENYESLTFERELVNGVNLELDTAMIATERRFDTEFTVTDAQGAPLSNVNITLEGSRNTFQLTTNELGQAFQRNVFNSEEFTVYITRWGSLPQVIEGITSIDLQNIQVTLEAGYRDDFVSDLGWKVTGNAESGIWEISEPIATSFGGQTVAPGEDIGGDIGGSAYVTGNGGGGAGTDDVDGGATTITSPDITPLENFTSDLVISYHYWFVNSQGEGTPDDTLKVLVANDREMVVARQYVNDGTVNFTGTFLASWEQDSFRVSDFISLTDGPVRVIVTTADLGVGNLVEAGFDGFAVREITPATSTRNDLFATASATLYPNPTAAAFELEYDVPTPGKKLTLRVTDPFGRIVSARTLPDRAGTVTLGDDLRTGFYIIELIAGNRRAWVTKVVKQ